jgi:hypothetical protein
LCGSIVGRSQTKEGDDGLTTTCFKILKYAIRPVTSNPSESLNIPLSAFIVEDMMEYVQAHASYRFVIRDEEEEKPRILVRLVLCLISSRIRNLPIFNVDLVVQTEDPFGVYHTSIPRDTQERFHKCSESALQTAWSHRIKDSIENVRATRNKKRRVVSNEFIGV